MTIYNVCVGLGFLIEAIIAEQYFNSTFSKKHTKSTSLIFILAGYLLLFLLFSLSSFLLNTVAFVSINFVLCFFLYDSGKKESIFHTFILTTLLFISEIIVFFLCIQLLGNLPNESSDVTGSIYVLTNKIGYFLLLQILIKIFEHKKDNLNTQTAIIGILILTPISTILIYLVLLHVLLTIEFPVYMQLLILGCCVLLSICNISIYVNYQKNQLLNKQYIETTLKLEKEILDHEYYQMLNEQRENQHILIHDVKKHIQILTAYSENDNLQKLKEYLLQINSLENLNSDFEISDNSTLNLVLYRYKKVCQSSNIHFEINAVPDSINFMLDSEITSLFGNLLQNAYESALNQKNSFINLSIIYDKKRNFTDVRLVNSYDPQKIKLKNNILITNKNDSYNHGYGIKSIKRIVKKYDGIYNFHENKEECIFQSFISISN